jgi:hypothetical protein
LANLKWQSRTWTNSLANLKLQTLSKPILWQTSNYKIQPEPLRWQTSNYKHYLNHFSDKPENAVVLWHGTVVIIICL